MSLHQEITNGVKEALKSKDGRKLSVLRGLLSSCTNHLVATGRKPNEILNDNEVLTVIKKQVKQRKDSIKQYQDGNRPELAEAEQAEMAILETYLPEPIPDEKIEAIIKSKKEELGLKTKADAGRLIGAVIKETNGQADGQRVKTLIEKLLD
ncbi:MAG: GatB/YqeY domain-containing protein [Patescibacteria group bacterium]